MGELVECEHGDEITSLMSLDLDGLLEAGDKQRLQQHLSTCSSCQVEWEGMRQVSVLFETAPMAGPPLGFALRVEQELEERARTRRRTFGGLAVLSSSLSLAGVTVWAVALVVVGLVAWYWLGSVPGVQQGTGAFTQVAAGLGLLGKGASLFLMDLLRRYGPPLVLALTIGLALLAGMWTWLFVKRPGSSQRNGYV
jgi:predicted anti-sigma-YlaC factor YlaD